MRYDYYLAYIHLVVDSEIELDSYEIEKKFLQPVLPVKQEYEIIIRLVDKITIPTKIAVQGQLYRQWMEDNQTEIRVYPYGDISSEGIESRLQGNRIVISIRRKIWKMYMNSFRIWSYIHLERILLQSDALILHSASILWQGKAILFTAPSETGKTTQTDIWHRNDPSVTDLNGDRTILQRTDDGWLACGIPISGTSTRCEQVAAPIGAVALVNRARIDSVSELSLVQKMKFLYGQITVFAACSADAEKALDLLQDFVMQERVLQLNCTMKDSAYVALYKALKLEENHHGYI